MYDEGPQHLNFQHHSVEHLHHRADHIQGHEHELEPHDRHPHSSDVAHGLVHEHEL